MMRPKTRVRNINMNGKSSKDFISIKKRKGKTLPEISMTITKDMPRT